MADTATSNIPGRPFNQAAGAMPSISGSTASALPPLDDGVGAPLGDLNNGKQGAQDPQLGATLGAALPDSPKTGSLPGSAEPVTASSPSASVAQVPQGSSASTVVPASQTQTSQINAQAIFPSPAPVNLIQYFASLGKINPEQMALLQKDIASNSKSPEEALLGIGIEDSEIYKAKAAIANIEYVEVANIDIDQQLLQLIPAATARQYHAVPIAKTASGLKVAMSDALDLQKIKYITTVVGQQIVPVFASPTQINFVIDNKYGAAVGDEVEEALEDVGDQSGQLIGVIGETTDLASGDLASAPVSKIVNMILEYAIRYKSSDVHIEPRENKVSVRFRIYGVLSEKLTLPKKLLAAVVSRVKILSNLKIDEHRLPQDGRFQVKMGDNAVDLRVSIVPAVYGEKVVMRLLEKGGGALKIEDTGLRGYALKIYRQALTRTQGILLVTGPTGSGKTQTLASSLNILNTPEVNIMTLEDPVEIRVDGVNQVQINSDLGLTFARGLRSFLRQDPDIIMVGEIRDGETASLAVQAALTGHLVLATLHTNSAAGAMPRLVDMGVEPFLLSSTLNVVLAQRLVRRVCVHCREAYYAAPEIVEQIHKIMDGIKTYNIFELPNNKDNEPNNIKDDQIVLYKGKGCAQCNNTGYKGRVGIFEAIDVSEDIGKLILQHAADQDIARTAVSTGMVTMVQDGFMKALEGITTIEEVLRVQTSG